MSEMMAYDDGPFRNRMDDDEDMPRGYKPKPMMYYSEHVEISLYDESDVNEINDLIDERMEQDGLDICVTCDSMLHQLWYVFEGTEEQLVEMRKTIRRLSRGKPRFMFVFEGMNCLARLPVGTQVR